MSLFDYPDASPVLTPLSEITLLADLSKDDWARLLNLVVTRPFSAGEDLIKVGEREDAFYILVSGVVDVVVDSGGGEKILASIAEGSVFGEIAFFDGSPRSATIRARTPGSAIRVSRDSCERLSVWEPRIARQMLFDLGAILAMRLRRTTEHAM